MQIITVSRNRVARMAPASGGSGPVPSKPYTTTFPLTENPISENGAWTMWGKTTGLDWDDMQSGGGNAFGAYVNEQLADFRDCTSLLGGTWSPDQECEGVIYGVSALASGCNQEIEIRLRSQISAHVNRGYELFIRAKVIGETNYAAIARWNGAVNDFTAFAFVNNFTLADGDVLRCRVTGQATVTMSIFLNDNLLVSDTDSTAQRWTDGNPGMGCHISPFTDSGCFTTPSAFGFSSFTAREI